MKKNIKDTKLLIDFFSRGLTGEEKEEFLQKATTDPDFLKRFIKGIELDKAFDQMLDDNTENVAKSDSGRFSDIFRTVFNRKRLRIITYVISGAAVITFGLFFGLEQYKKSHPEQADLFTRYYEPFDLGITRSCPGEKSTAYLYYKYMAKDFQAIRQIDINELDTEIPKGIIYLIYSVTAIEHQDYPKAAELLDMVPADEDCYSISCWYKALLYLKDERYAEAVPMLQVVLDNSLMFRSETYEILDILKEKGLID
jgi:hypothetical protein